MVPRAGVCPTVEQENAVENLLLLQVVMVQKEVLQNPAALMVITVTT